MMILHLLKSPANPLAMQAIKAHPQTSTVAVFLSPVQDIPHIPGVPVYHVSGTASGEHVVSYSHLIDLIFEAEKVVAW